MRFKPFDFPIDILLRKTTVHNIKNSMQTKQVGLGLQSLILKINFCY